MDVWVKARDSDGRIYHYHRWTRESRWTKPDETVSSSEKTTYSASTAVKEPHSERKLMHAPGGRQYCSYLSASDIILKPPTSIYMEPSSAPIYLPVRSQRANDMYQYEPLEPGQIRLIAIEPAKSYDEVFRCRMHYIRLHATNTPFMTLSYTWGQTYPDGSHLTRGIVCNDRQMRTTENLYHALKRIRQKQDEEAVGVCRGSSTQFRSDYSAWKGKRMLLWVDAICIDQSPSAVQERSSQVQSMAEIYCNSPQLLVWLGGTPDQGRMIENLINQAQGFRSHGRSQNREQPLTRQEISVLKEVLDHPWFTRRWVLQEIYQSMTVHFLLGDTLIEQAAFALYFADFIATYSGREEYALQQLVLDLYPGSVSPSGTLDIMQRFDRSECSDPRDRIYATLGLSHHSESLVVDYNLSVEQLYLSYAEDLVLKGYGIRVMACAASRLPLAHEQHQSLHLPTWVPDWRIHRIPNRSLDFLDEFADLRASTQKLSVQPNGRLLLWGWVLRPCKTLHKTLHQQGNPQCSTCRFITALYGQARVRFEPIYRAMDDPELVDTSLAGGRLNKDIKSPERLQMPLKVYRGVEQLLRSTSGSYRVVFPGNSSSTFRMMKVKGCRPRCYQLTASSRVVLIHTSDLSWTENDSFWTELLTTCTSSPGREIQIA